MSRLSTVVCALALTAVLATGCGSSSKSAASTTTVAKKPARTTTTAPAGDPGSSAPDTTAAVKSDHTASPKFCKAYDALDQTPSDAQDLATIKKQTAAVLPLLRNLQTAEPASLKTQIATLLAAYTDAVGKVQTAATYEAAQNTMAQLGGTPGLPSAVTDIKNYKLAHC